MPLLGSSNLFHNYCNILQVLDKLFEFVTPAFLIRSAQNGRRMHGRHNIWGDGLKRQQLATLLCNPEISTK